jgi:hypothetical protein
MAGGGNSISTAELYQPTDLTSPPGLMSLGIDPVSPAVVAGTTQAFTATGVFADGTLQNENHCNG